MDNIWLSTLYRTAIIAVNSTLLLTGLAQADTIEGKVTAVGPEGKLQIALPVGASVSQGEKVKILSELPGLGLVAIATSWSVIGIEGTTVTATPEQAPSGTPQVGYVAQIEAEVSGAVASTVLEPIPFPDDPMTGQNFPDHHAVTASPEARSLFLAAQSLADSQAQSDRVMVVELLRRAADMGLPEAMTELGARYSFGRGVIRDDIVALKWQRLAADHANSEALLRIGLINATGRGVPVNEKIAAGWIKGAASYGNVNAMYLMAMLHEDGLGVEQSIPKMVHWFELAAKNGHVEAMFFLGQIYENGEDGIILKDIKKTEKHWLLAANAGHVGAMRGLSEFYEGKSPRDSLKWRKAAHNSVIQVNEEKDLRCLSRWECYAEKTIAQQEQTYSTTLGSVEPSQVPQTQRTVNVTYAVQGCDRYAASPRDPDRPDPQLSVEYSDLDPDQAVLECLEDIKHWPDTRRFYTQIARGYHKKGQYKEAFDAAKMSADMGSSQGMSMIGMLYKTGKSVPQDSPKALQWIEKAAHKGNITAMHFAASMLLQQDGVPYNPQAAAKWLQAAADKGSIPAFAHLGILYNNGQGLPYDPVEAAKYLMMGHGKGSALSMEYLTKNPNNLSKKTRVEVQRLLHKDNRYQGAFDGHFGPQTLKALRRK